MCHSKVMGSLALVSSLVLGSSATGQGTGPVDEASEGGELRTATLRQVITGLVCMPDGSPAVGAAITTSEGGRAVSGSDGGFTIEVLLPLDVVSLEVSASAETRQGSGSLVASTRFVLPALSTAASVGTLALTPTSSCAPQWLPTFGRDPGTNGQVRAFATFDDGQGPGLFVGGSFSSAAGEEGGLARWDGSRWSVFDGTDGIIHALAVFDDGSGPALYAGGDFQTAGGLAAANIARWDGSSWSGVGGGVPERTATSRSGVARTP